MVNTRFIIHRWFFSFASFGSITQTKFTKCNKILEMVLPFWWCSFQFYNLPFFSFVYVYGTYFHSFPSIWDIGIVCQKMLTLIGLCFVLLSILQFGFVSSFGFFLSSLCHLQEHWLMLHWILNVHDWLILLVFMCITDVYSSFIHEKPTIYLVYSLSDRSEILDLGTNYTIHMHFGQNTYYVFWKNFVDAIFMVLVASKWSHFFRATMSSALGISHHIALVYELYCKHSLFRHIYSTLQLTSINKSPSPKWLFSKSP